MIQRTISTIVLWSLVLVCLRLFGTTGGIWLIAAISVLTLHEFFALLRSAGLNPFRRLGLVFCAAIMLAPRYFEPYLSATEVLALAVIAFSVRILGEREPQDRVETLAWSVFGLAYIPFMLHFLVRTLLLTGPTPQTGLVLGLWLIVVTKFCDMGAFLTGLAIGRHKLAPKISPKKTWEGAAGGIVLSVATGAVLAWGCRSYVPSHFTPLVAAGLAAPLAAAGIVADLVESIIKRRVDAKDAGRTIPGIGGVFDLSDSLILAAPLGWAVFHLL